jgi:hypothetical protein
MAKKRNQQESTEEAQRQSRKDVLLARRQAEQSRQAKIIVGVVVGIIALVLVVALVNEFIISPQQAVASVRDEEINLQNWQDRVRYQRAQFITTIEDQLEAFGDLATVQQFNQQQINLLLNGEELGRLVLEQMVDEEVIAQEAAARGITVTDEEVDERIGEQFNYFGGGLPTPFPTPTETIMPTPSITPIPTAVITEVLPTNTPFPTPTTGPTATPPPTATPVSQESFETDLDDLLDRFRRMGVDEETFRETVRQQILREKLADALAEEEELATEEEMVSAFVLSFGTEEEAEAALAQIEAEGFLEVWNQVRSQPPDPDVERPPAATEQLWRTRDQLVGTYTEEAAEVLFDTETGEYTVILEVPGETEEQLSRFYIFQVSGREVRPLAAGTIDGLKSQLVSDLITTVRNAGDVETTQLWRTRWPSNPRLDPDYLVQPTVAPTPSPLVPLPTTIITTPEGDQ